jgi:hypothetical protein
VISSLDRNGRIPVQPLNTRINRNPLDVVADLITELCAPLICPPPLPALQRFVYGSDNCDFAVEEAILSTGHKGSRRVQFLTIWTLECWYNAGTWFYGHYGRRLDGCWCRNE